MDDQADVTELRSKSIENAANRWAAHHANERSDGLTTIVVGAAGDRFVVRALTGCDTFDALICSALRGSGLWPHF